MHKCSIDMAIFHGDLDALANPTDVAWLMSDQSGLDLSLIKFQRQLHYAHSTFLIGNKNMSYVSEDIVPLIEQRYQRRQQKEANLV